MKLKRKTIVLISVIIVATLLVGSVLAATSPEGSALDQLWDAIFGIEEDVEDLQTQIDLQAQIAELETEIAQLQAQMEFLEDPWIVGPQGPQGETGPQGPAGGFGAPDYDSGWVSISQGSQELLTHNLGTSDIFVYLIGHYASISRYHQTFIGLDYQYVSGNLQIKGAHWYAPDNDSILVARGIDDEQWEEFRLLIWIIS